MDFKFKFIFGRCAVLWILFAINEVLTSMSENSAKILDPIHVDIESDVPSDGHWVIDCPSGYSVKVSDFDCREGGGISFPEQDLSGQIGFWTTCEDLCQIKYKVQPGDLKYAARVYQKGLQTEISYDGVTWEFVDGEGWIDIKRDFTRGEEEVSIQIPHLSPDYFVVLDRIVVNGELPPVVPVEPTVHIDVEADVPSDGHWIVDCPSGYSEQVSDFNCREGGGISFPEKDLSGQIGFWTTCEDTCKIIYRVQPGDFNYAARVYQKGLSTEFSYDGVNWDFIDGEGWVDIKRDFEIGQTEISIQIPHLSPDFFVILDRLVVNGELPPVVPIEPTTTASPIPTESETTTTEVTSELKPPVNQQRPKKRGCGKGFGGFPLSLTIKGILRKC